MAASATTPAMLMMPANSLIVPWVGADEVGGPATLAGVDGFGSFFKRVGARVTRVVKAVAPIAAPIVGGDAYHGMWNSSSEHKTFFGRYDPVTGAMQLGQELTARLANTRANTCWCEQGNIKADETGRVYLAGITTPIFPFRFNPVPDTEYEGGPFALLMSPHFQARQFAGRVNSGGYLHTIAARTLAGQAAPHVVFGGQWNGPTLWIKNPLQAAPAAARQGFFAVKPQMPPP